MRASQVVLSSGEKAAAHEAAVKKMKSDERERARAAFEADQAAQEQLQQDRQATYDKRQV
jgi:hypothetical protein